MRALSRTWQILFKGYDEVARAGYALQAAEMVLIRLAYAADLPSPDEVISKLGADRASSGVQATQSPAAVSSQPAPFARPNGGGTQALRVEAPRAQATPVPVQTPVLANPQSYNELVGLAAAKRDLLVKHALEADLRPVSFSAGRIEVALRDGADPGIIATLSARLQAWTGQRWLVTVSTRPPAGATLRELADQRREAARGAAGEDPLVRAIIETFPGAKLVDVRVREEAPAYDLPPAPDLEEDDE
jgi:DNA polymerase-3 subunit gamma/tau